MSMLADESRRKPLVLIGGQIKSPPIAPEARIEIGTLLSRLQNGDSIGMPHSRPMPDIGRRCHELRVRDGRHNWRVIYRIDPTAIVVVEVFAKTTQQTPKSIIDLCKTRLSDFDRS